MLTAGSSAARRQFAQEKSEPDASHMATQSSKASSTKMRTLPMAADARPDMSVALTVSEPALFSKTNLPTKPSVAPRT
eukprot:scaffold63_cov306-Pinguiococcus_pyrenoidosus.AAC.42